MHKPEFAIKFHKIISETVLEAKAADILTLSHTYAETRQNELHLPVCGEGCWFKFAAYPHMYFYPICILFQEHYIT